MHNQYRRPRSQPIALVGFAGLAVLLIALFAVVQGDDDPPRCPVSRSGAVDMVPSGVRPCVLYGYGPGVATGNDNGYQHSGTTPRPRATVKGPGAPKAPAAKPAAPAAPKVISPPRR